MRASLSRYLALFVALAVVGAIVLSTAQASSSKFKFIRSFASGNGMQSGPGQLSTPEGIAVVPSSGNVLVADSMNNRIEEFSAKGKFVAAFGSLGPNPGQFNDPDGLGINRKGDIYVADVNNGRVEEFSPSFTFIRSFGTFTNSPGSLVVAPNGDVYVTDGPFIRHFTGSGVAEPSFGASGNGRAQFNSTIGGLGISPKGYVFATDYSGMRVEQFRPTGQFVRSLANTGKSAVVGGLGIAVTDTSIYISDNGHGRVVQLRLDGSFVRQFGTNGKAKLDNPGTVGVDCAGNVYISDLDVGRVREFGNPYAPHKGCR